MKKIIITSLAIIISFLVGTVSVDAYALTGWKFSTISESYKWGNNISKVSSSYKNAFIKAVDSWNNAVNVKYSYHYNSKNTCDTYSKSSNSEYGTTVTTYNSNKKVVEFHSKINSANTNITGNVYQSVAAHELGHPYGLGDLSSGNSLMSHARNRNTIYKPQTDDINEIKRIYPEWY